MITFLVFYLVIALTFKQNEGSPTKEQDINITESIEKEIKEPISPVFNEKQEKVDIPVKNNEHSKQNEEEVKSDEMKTYSTRLQTYSIENEEREVNSTEIETFSKEKDNKKPAEPLTTSKQKEEGDLKVEAKVNMLKAAENITNVTNNLTRREANFEETQNILKGLSEVAKDDPSATTHLPFPLVTMDDVLYNKTAQLIRVIQNAAVQSHDEKSYDKLSNAYKKSQENPKDERRYIISNFDVLESYMNSRRSKIHPSSRQREINANLNEEGAIASEWSNKKGNYPKAKEYITDHKERSYKDLNYDDRSDDYILSTTKHNIWDYEHESWAVVTERVSWDGVESSGERERDSDESSSEEKEDVQKEHEILRLKEKDQDDTVHKKIVNNKEDELISVNLNTKKENCDDKDIVVKVKTISAIRETETYNKLSNREEGISVQKPNKHIQNDDTMESRINHKNLVNKPKYDDSLNSNTLSAQHQKKRERYQRPIKAQKIRDDVNNNDQFDIIHRADRSNKIPSLQNSSQTVENPSGLSSQESSEKLQTSNLHNFTKRREAIPFIRTKYERKLKDTDIRRKRPDESKTKMVHKLPHRKDTQEERRKQKDSYEITERTSKHQLSNRSDKNITDSKSFIKHTIDNIAKNDMSNNFDNRSNKKKSQSKNIDLQDSREAKPSKNRKLRDDYSDEAIRNKQKNKQNTHEPWNRHANNEWDKVGINNGKKEITRPTTKRFNNKNEGRYYDNPQDMQKDSNGAKYEHEGKNIKWSEERNDRKKEGSKSSNVGRIEKYYNKFEDKTAKNSGIDYDDTIQGQENTRKDNSYEAKTSKNSFLGETMKGRNKNINWQDDYKDDYRTNEKKSYGSNNKNIDWRHNREGQTTKNQIVKDTFSREGEKNSYDNDRNTKEPWDRHAHNEWDNVGVNSGKREITRRTTKRYNDYNDYDPQRSDEVTTYKVEKQIWNRHQNNNWDEIGVNNNKKEKLKLLSRSRLSENNDMSSYGRTALPFREKKSVYDSDDNKKIH